MIIGLESVNAAAARIIEMNADKDGILLHVFDRDSFFEWNENVGVACHHDFEMRFAELAGQTLRDIQGRDFLGSAKSAVGAVVLASMTGVDHHGVERLARVLW